MKNILVSGACALMGYGILKSIRMSNEKYNLIGTTIHDYDDTVAPKYCDIVLKAPLTLSEGFRKWILNVIRQYKIDLIVPSFEIDVGFWDENRDILDGTGVKLALNSPELIALCKDKWDFYKILENANCPYVIPTELISDFEILEGKFGLPLFLKPRRGSASKGTVKVTDKRTFKLHENAIGSELMVQPYVGNDNEEFTTGAFCDGKGGYYAIITFKRQLSNEGYTNKAEVFESELIKEAVLNICKILKPFGPTNFQFRMSDGVCRLLEINPRFSASTSMRSAFGYNDPLMAIDFYLEGKVPKQPIIAKGKAVRYIEEYIFYK